MPSDRSEEMKAAAEAADRAATQSFVAEAGGVADRLASLPEADRAAELKALEGKNRVMHTLVRSRLAHLGLQD